MKKIYLYDLNMPSLMAFICREIEEKGIEIIHIEKLTWIDEDNDYPIVINPLSSVMVEHWETMKRFIPNNPKRRIVMVTPDYSKKQLEEIVGIHSHLKIFGDEIDFEALLKELTE
jgi:hypothetical protein